MFNLQKIRCIKLATIAVLTCCICLATTSTTPLIAKSPDWVVLSNNNANLLKKAINAKDCQQKLAVSDRLREINPAFKTCRHEKVLDTVKAIEQKLIQAKNPELRIDLSILQKFGRRRLRLYELNEQYQVPYADLSLAILEEFKSTLEEIESPDQQQQVILTKLKQYAGVEAAQTALAKSLEQAIETQMRKSEVVLPRKEQLESDLEDNATHISEILAFLEEQQVPGYQQAYEQLKTQLYDYETFIRRKILTKKREDFRLPAEMYAFRLEQQGIEIPIEELIKQAHIAFDRIQQQMDVMAQKIAKQRGIEISSYQDVVLLLEQEQLSAEETLKEYRQRAQDLEDIIRREDLVTLPNSKCEIRLATESEKKDIFFPSYDSISNTVIIPVFQNPQKATAYNDFINTAKSWSTMAHEGRPGHDLQFTTIENSNLPLARTDFFRHKSNTEGWAVYAEIVMFPYLPLEGQFMALQQRLINAAQAFSGLELQLGRITTGDAIKLWTEDLGFSRLLIEEQLQKSPSETPGIALAYFYGSQRLLQLREQAQQRLRDKFTMKKFHDFVLSQGFLPSELLQQAINTKMT